MFLIALALGLTTAFPAAQAQSNAIYVNYEVTGTEHQPIRSNVDLSATIGGSEGPLPRLPLVTHSRKADLNATGMSPAGLDAPQQSRTGPVPPPEVLERDARKPPDRAKDILSASTLPAPAYAWRHGCGPTAVGMVVGYYDALGYDDLIPGSGITQTDAVNQAIASGGDATNPYPPGSERHYEDYARPLDSSPYLLDDDYITSGRTPHADRCIADYMDTSKSTHYNYYGWSWSDGVGPAFVDYVNQQNSAYEPSFRQYNTFDGTLTWSVLTSEIGAGRPMVFLVDTDGNGGTDHFVTIIGYRTSPSLQYGCWDTWSTTNVRWENFAAIAPGTPWGIWGGWALSLSTTLTVAKDGTGSGSVMSIPAGIDCGITCTATFGYGTVVTLTATADVGSTFTDWSGACTNVSGPCVVAITQARNVTAVFVTYQIYLPLAIRSYP